MYKNSKMEILRIVTILLFISMSNCACNSPWADDGNGICIDTCSDSTSCTFPQKCNSTTSPIGCNECGNNATCATPSVCDESSSTPMCYNCKSTNCDSPKVCNDYSTGTCSDCGSENCTAAQCNTTTNKCFTCFNKDCGDNDCKDDTTGICY